MSKPYYIVYYRDSVKIARFKPVGSDFPGSRFAEGPLRTRPDVDARLGWMGRPPHFKEDPCPPQSQ